MFYANRYMRYVDQIDLVSRPGVAHSPSIWLAGTDAESCIAISLGPDPASWCFPVVALPPTSISDPSRGFGKTEYLRVHDLVPY